MAIFLKTYLLKILITLFIAGGGYWFFAHRGGSTYQFVTVQQGSITETVSVTGNTTPMQSVSLGFQNAGTIAHVYRRLGDKVSAGEIIARLNIANLSAALQQAEANVDTQQAKLDGLKAGSRPADIATSEAVLQKAQQDLANLYISIRDSSASGYAKANDAVRTQLNILFSNSETSQPQLLYMTTNSQAAINATGLRVSTSIELNAWQQELMNLSSSPSFEALAMLLKNDLSHLAIIQNLLNAISLTLDGNINLSVSQLATNKANVTTGLTEVNASISNLNTIFQNIASQQATVAQTEAQLALKQAGSTPEDIAGQLAQVAQAQAGVANAKANLQNAEIVAPISGIITQQDAKAGQLASPGTPIISIIGNSGFEVEAGTSETDVGKLTIGDKVTMTLDAFPNETFMGLLFYIAPSQTNIQGVITYQIKISFDKPDPRLKSGLTANINIETNHKENVLILPQYAILQNNQGTFVETLENNKVIENPVTLGIQDQKGNVEVVSGVTSGEQVLNIGLKTTQ
ncbi:MAG: efflux RND transporter periplasmic adaptor subunit [bacterium]|nr:efflux RND transporter periplasmic adaptor subunit [bacterium]